MVSFIVLQQHQKGMKKETTYTKTGRSTTSAYPTGFLLKSLSARCASAALIPALLQAPAFFSCQKTPESPRVIHIFSRQSVAPTGVDLFFFDTAGVQKLDSYQQLSSLEDLNYAVSGSGPKRMVALSARPGITSSWMDIATFGNLCKHRFSLDEDHPYHPLLAGQVLLEDGAARDVTLPLETMLTAIRIGSVSCDFSGRPYSGKVFNNHTLFLTFAAVECQPLEAGTGRAVSWMNMGDIDSVSTLKLPFPEMLLQKGPGLIGPERVQLDQTFYCYSNVGEDMPRTHLVLAGSVDGAPCYYPIPLPTLEGGKCYELNVTLRRMGSPSADIPTESGTISLETHILPWEERATYTVTY